MRKTLALLGGLATGVAFSQFPEYAQQYEQRLGGAVDELRAITADFDRGASAAGLTRDEAFARYETASDDFLAGRGRSMQATFARYGKLSGDLAELDAAGPWERLRHLPDYLDSEVGARTLQTYQPAVPVTPEGFAWGAAGLIAGYGLFGALIGFVLLPFRWRRGQVPGRTRLGRRRQADVTRGI